MRTTMDLDADLIKRLVKESGASSKTEAIEIAAREYIALQNRRRLIESFGTWDIAPAYEESRRLSRREEDRIAHKLAPTRRRHAG